MCWGNIHGHVSRRKVEEHVSNPKQRLEARVKAKKPPPHVVARSVAHNTVSILQAATGKGEAEEGEAAREAKGEV